MRVVRAKQERAEARDRCLAVGRGLWFEDPAPVWAVVLAHGFAGKDDCVVGGVWWRNVVVTGGKRGRGVSSAPTVVGGSRPAGSENPGGGAESRARGGGEPCELPAPLALSAYRIVHEGLTNALKHSADATARVIVRYHPQQIEVEVLDDGTGSVNGSGTRRGLAGVGERVAVFGGRFEAGPRPEGGWHIRAALPLKR
jgi:Histidine kinase-, DNA gyrase B-, and HSP90-like ATPase